MSMFKHADKLKIVEVPLTLKLYVKKQYLMDSKIGSWFFGCSLGCSYSDNVINQVK